MNNKTLVIAIIILLIVGGGLVLAGKIGNNNKTPIPTPAVNQVQQQNQNGVRVSGASPITEKIETVNITSSGFEPQTLTIKKDVKVIWINRSGAKVKIDPASGYAPLTLGEFPDNSSVQLLFDKIGSYTYVNSLKPEQKGTIVVTE